MAQFVKVSLCLASWHHQHDLCCRSSTFTWAPQTEAKPISSTRNIPLSTAAEAATPSLLSSNPIVQINHRVNSRLEKWRRRENAPAPEWRKLSTDSRSCYRRAMGPSGLLTGSRYFLRIHRSCQRHAKKVGESSYKRTSVAVHPVLSLRRTCRRGCWQVSVRVTFSSR